MKERGLPKVSKLEKQEVIDTRIIKEENGYVLINGILGAVADQPLMTMEGWKRADNLTIKDKLFNKLIAKCTYAMDISERLTELQKESEAIFLICKDCKPLEKLRVWKSVCGEWWFDETYLGHKLDEIVNYFEIIEEYASLPRTRGSGHRIESWIESSDIETKYTNAQIQFSVLLNIGGKN